MKLNHFENVLEDENSRYPEVEFRELKGLDLIVLSSEPYPFKGKDVKEIGDNSKIETILADGEFFSWYGSRLQQAFSYFKTLH